MDWETVYCIVVVVLFAITSLPLFIINLLFIVGHILEEYDEE